MRWKGRGRWAGVSLFPSPTATFLLPTQTDAREDLEGGEGRRDARMQGCKVAGQESTQDCDKKSAKERCEKGVMRLAQIIRFVRCFFFLRNAMPQLICRIPFF